MEEQIKSLQLTSTELSKIKKFTIFLNELEQYTDKEVIQDFIKILKKDIVTQIIFSIFYELLDENLSFIQIDESRFITGGASPKELILFFMILILFSNMFSGVNTIFFNMKPSFFQRSATSVSTLTVGPEIRPVIEGYKTSTKSSSSPKSKRSRRSFSRTLKTLTRRTVTFPDVYSSINGTLNKIADQVNNKTTIAKDIKMDKFLKFFVASKSILMSSKVTLSTGTDILTSSTELSVSLISKNKELNDKVFLIIKIVDTLVKSGILALETMKVLTSGLTETYIVAFLKVSNSLGQIFQAIYRSEDIQLKNTLNTINNVFLFRDIGVLIKQLSLMYVAYIGLVVYSHFSKKKGGRTKRKRRMKRRKTKKLH
jgi:hypothetical protein